VRYQVNSSSKSTATIINPVTKTKGDSETIQERDFLKVDEITNYERGEFAGIFSDASIKYAKGFRVKLESLETRSSVPLRRDFSLDEMTRVYKQVYEDVASIFNSSKSQTPTHSESIKIDFES
jgi:hypothetical protein